MEVVFEWLRVNGDIVTAALSFVVMVLGFCTTVLVNLTKIRRAKNDKIQTELMTDILNKDTAKDDVMKLEEKVKVLAEGVYQVHEDQLTAKNQNILLGQMLGIIFENSTLSDDVKAQLTSLRTKMEYGMDASVLETLNDENQKLKEEVAVLKKEKEDAATKVTAEPVVTKKYSKKVVIQ